MNDVRLDEMPGRHHFRMSWAVGEFRTGANDDFSATARAGVDAELGVDLTILRHKTPKLLRHFGGHDQPGFNAMYLLGTSNSWRQIVTKIVIRYDVSGALRRLVTGGIGCGMALF